MRHLRIALYDVTSGSAEDAIEIARKGILPVRAAAGLRTLRGGQTRQRRHRVVQHLGHGR
jgi:hypothetical protein